MTTTEDPWAQAATADDVTGADAEMSFEDEFGDANAAENAAASASLPVGTKLPGFPKIPQLYGRLVIMEPLSFDPKAPTYANRMQGKADDFQEEFTVRLVVLDGEPIRVPELEKQEDGTWTKTGEMVSPEYPVVFYRLRIKQGRLIKQCKEKFDIATGAKKNGGKWLGRLRRSANTTFDKRVRDLPWAQQYDACDRIDAEYRAAAQAALANGDNPPAAPKFSPMISAYTPADVTIAKAYLVADAAERAARKAAA